jgi:hypothetical protein
LARQDLGALQIGGGQLRALNFAHDIATGSRSVEDAREFYSMTVMAHMRNQSALCVEEPHFSAQRGTADHDETTVSREQMQQAEEIKQRTPGASDAELT